MGRKKRKIKTIKKGLWDVEMGDTIYDPMTQESATVYREDWIGSDKANARFKRSRLLFCKKPSGVHCTVSGGKAKVVDIVGEE